MLRLREQFTERQRMEEFMEKKLTSVELKAADLRFTVMKENEVSFHNYSSQYIFIN
jgi:hypothetical protein